MFFLSLSIDCESLWHSTPAGDIYEKQKDFTRCTEHLVAPEWGYLLTEYALALMESSLSFSSRRSNLLRRWVLELTLSEEDERKKHQQHVIHYWSTHAHNCNVLLSPEALPCGRCRPKDIWPVGSALKNFTRWIQIPDPPQRPTHHLSPWRRRGSCWSSHGARPTQKNMFWEL